MSKTLTTIDMSPLFGGDLAACARTAAAIAAAAERDGFFYVVGHGVAADTVARLDALARDFSPCPRPRRPGSPWPAPAWPGGAGSRWAAN